ncbi:MAG: DUF4185 domain-containing protein [Acidimicrobiales bacterium]
MPAPARLAVGAALLCAASVALSWGSSPAGASSRAPSVRAPSAESRTPYGEMNLAWTEPGMIGLVGWAKDPDVNRPINVVVGITNPNGAPGLYVRTAGVYNPYLPGTTAEKYRSYLIAIPVSPGPHTMCVAALNVGKGNPNRLLGCKVFDVAPADPFGNLESSDVLPSGDVLRVSGWALDIGYVDPLSVKFTVDGAVAGRATANAIRPDVEASYPATGPAHGFVADVPIATGPHLVCAIATNIGRGADATIGCRPVLVAATQPIGNLESVTVGADSVTVTGWVGDPDAGGPIDVTLTDIVVGGVDDPFTRRMAASSSRPDVAAVTGLDARAGFTTSWNVTAPGVHVVCATGHNRGIGRDQLIACTTITIPDHRPGGLVASVTPLTSGLRVTGTAADPDTATPVTVRIDVDGGTTTTTANGGSFDATIGSLSAGRHSVCVTLPDLGGARPGINGDRPLPCGTVIVTQNSPNATAVGTSGAVGPPTAVGPATGPVVGVDRDAGVTTRLRDGSVLWLFGDSVGYDSAGAMRYFVGGTGGWAPAGAPAITRDAGDADGSPYVLATPTATYPACTAQNPHQVMWPVSAVTVPAGSRDRVIVFLSDMCLGSPTDYRYEGMAVAEWYYDPAAPPDGRPVQLTILDQKMATSRPFGTAAVIDDSGWLLMYACDRPANLADPAAFGPCRVARVDPNVVVDESQYRYWNGSTWVAGEGNAQPVTMPSGGMAGYDYPASSFTVTWDAPHGVYVMAYSPWPGFTDKVVVRVSREPEGPWSVPVVLTLPGCDETVAGASRNCYGATPQPAFSASDRLGIGWYDQAVPADRRRGQYHVATVPFVTVLS